MELRQLQYFVAVAEEENFTRGAEKVHVAQPGVSAQIRRLEREFGQPLFDRSGRTVKLTRAGEVVLPYARAALAAVSDARQAVDDLSGLLRGQVTVGSTLRPPLDLPRLIAEFSACHHHIDVSLLASDSASLLADVASGNVDVAVVDSATDPPEKLEAQCVAWERLVAVVAPEDDLADRDVLSLADLTERRVITLPVGAGTRAALERACEDAGVATRVAFEASAPRVLSELAALGFGVAVLPESVAVFDPETQRAVPFDHGAMRIRLDLVWREANCPAAQALVDHVRAATEHLSAVAAPEPVTRIEAARVTRLAPRVEPVTPDITPVAVPEPPAA